MKIEVWSLPGCHRCEAAKAAIRAAGHEAVERDLQAAADAGHLNAGIYAQSQMQHGYAPVLRVPGERFNEFIDPEFLADWLAKHPAGE
jgi:glutaredoxin